MAEILRRIEVPIGITIICTLLQIIPYYFNIPPLLAVSDLFRRWMLLVARWATFVGAVTLMIVHSKNVQQQKKGWPLSIIVVASIFLLLLPGLPIPEIGLGTKNAFFDYLFTYVYSPLGSTMYSIIAFFITSAAYRAFRARSVEAFLVLFAGILLICKNAPIMTYLWPPFVPIGNWIYDVPNMATMRAVIIGAAFGAIALAVRTLMGTERGYLRGGREE
jgi:hypothetical protein